MDCQGLSLWERWHGVSRDGEGEDASHHARASLPEGAGETVRFCLRELFLLHLS